jgi:ribosomal protein S18 acetylase RimI-like enzyme
METPTIRPATDMDAAAVVSPIQELVVRDSHRGQGIGENLVRMVVARARASGCAEVSVSTMPDNQGAQRFYRRLGFADEAVFLEMHLDD